MLTEITPIEKLILGELRDAVRNRYAMLIVHLHEGRVVGVFDGTKPVVPEKIKSAYDDEKVRSVKL